MDERLANKRLKQAQPFGLQFAEEPPTASLVVDMGQPAVSQEVASQLGLEYDAGLGYNVARKGTTDIPFLRWLVGTLNAAKLFPVTE